MRPTVGRIVHYTLTSSNAEQINRRRTTGNSIADRLAESPPAWPAGAQAHIGNAAREGDVLPLLICRVWPDEYGAGVDGVNGQVFLDGNDQLWVTSAKEGTEAGSWAWPPRA